MDYEIRYADPSEFPAVAALDGASFGLHYTAQDLEDAGLDVDVRRLLVADADREIVAVSGELAFDMTLPIRSTPPTCGW